MNGSSQPLIAVRIKDGIFVGNVTAAHDEDFLFMNKVTHIVNCAGAEVRDLFEDAGIHYLTFPWKDTSGTVCTTVMFDSADRNVESAVRFIDKGLENGECVLVHSYFGLSRSCALVAAYLMVKYGWKVDNALAFLEMAHPDMNIKPHFLRQLRTFARRHSVDHDVFDPEVDDTTFALDNDQWMLRNTLLNGLTAERQENHPLFTQASAAVALGEPVFKNPARRRRRVSFVDTKQGTGFQTGASRPVVQPTPTHHHVDPYSGAATSFSGHHGLLALRTGRPQEPIAARRDVPNDRCLLSQDSINPKGRQSLQLRRTTAAVAAGPAAHGDDGGAAVATAHVVAQTRVYPEFFTAPAAAATPAATPQMAVASAQHTIMRPPAQPVAAAATTAATATTPAQQQQQTAGKKPTATSGAVRSPFALSLSSAAHRNGSPLPQQRNPQRAAAAPPPPAAAPASEPPGSLRYASPQVIPSLGQLHARGSSPMARTQRTNSPLNVRPDPNASSSAIEPLAAAAAKPSLLSAANRSLALQQQAPPKPRAASPTQRPAVGPSSGTVPHALTTIVAPAQPTPVMRSAYNPPPPAVTRTSSPMAVQRTPLQLQSTRPASPMTQRPSAVVGQRTSSPRGQAAPPSRSLAEQYLGITIAEAARPKETTSSILRRQQPVTSAARK